MPEKEEIVVFLIKNNNTDSWSGSSYVYPNVFGSKESARKFVGEKATYFADIEKEIEPYFSILELPVVP